MSNSSKKLLVETQDKQIEKSTAILKYTNEPIYSLRDPAYHRCFRHGFTLNNPDSNIYLLSLVLFNFFALFTVLGCTHTPESPTISLFSLEENCWSPPKNQKELRTEIVLNHEIPNYIATVSTHRDLSREFRIYNIKNKPRKIHNLKIPTIINPKNLFHINGSFYILSHNSQEDSLILSTLTGSKKIASQIHRHNLIKSISANGYIYIMLRNENKMYRIEKIDPIQNKKIEILKDLASDYATLKSINKNPILVYRLGPNRIFYRNLSSKASFEHNATNFTGTPFAFNMTGNLGIYFFAGDPFDGDHRIILKRVTQRGAPSIGTSNIRLGYFDTWNPRFFLTESDKPIGIFPLLSQTKNMVGILKNDKLTTFQFESPITVKGAYLRNNKIKAHLKVKNKYWTEDLFCKFSL